MRTAAQAPPPPPAARIHSCPRRLLEHEVPCRIYSDQDLRPSPVDGYDRPGSVRGCNGLGYSIWPRPVFNPTETALLAIERAVDRERGQPNPQDDVIQAGGLLLTQARRRQVNDDDETLTLVRVPWWKSNFTMWNGQPSAPGRGPPTT